MARPAPQPLQIAEGNECLGVEIDEWRLHGNRDDCAEEIITERVRPRRFVRIIRRQRVNNSNLTDSIATSFCCYGAIWQYEVEVGPIPPLHWPSLPGVAGAFNHQGMCGESFDPMCAARIESAITCHRCVAALAEKRERERGEQIQRDIRRAEEFEHRRISEARDVAEYAHHAAAIGIQIPFPYNDAADAMAMAFSMTYPRARTTSSSQRIKCIIEVSRVELVRERDAVAPIMRKLPQGLRFFQVVKRADNMRTNMVEFTCECEVIGSPQPEPVDEVVEPDHPRHIIMEKENG